MKINHLRATTALVAVLSFVTTTFHAERAEARGLGNVLGGVGVGAVMGLMIGGAMARQRQPRVYRQAPPRYRVAAPRQRKKAVDPVAANQIVQRALAALGLYEGPISGKIDKPTQVSIAAFQQKIGEKPTGKLTAPQRQVLFANYAQNARPIPPAQTVTGQPGGLFALIAAGGGAATGAITAAGAASAPGFIAEPALPSTSVAPATSGSQSAPAATSELSKFFASVCRDDTPLENPLASRTVLSVGALKLTPKQFCVAREAAISESYEALTKSGQTDIANVRAGCRTFADGMKAHVTAAFSDHATATIQKLQKEFAGTSPDASITNFKICLGIGYVEDQPDMILASALGLVGIGEAGYAELIGGVFGIGITPLDNKTRATEWLDFAASQIEKGASTVVKELGADRAGVLKLVVKELRGDAPKPTTVALADTKIEVKSTVSAPNFAPATPQQSAEKTVVITPAAPAVTANTNTVAPADPRETMVAQARAFFTKEGADQTVKLEALSSVLGLDKAEIGKRCEAFVSSAAPADAAKGLDPAMTLRLCRAWSYSTANNAAMFALDKKLSDSGDAEAASRLPFHMIAGNDKTPVK